MVDKSLPPLPPSDKKSMLENYYDSFYRQTSKEFWRNNKIQSIIDEDVPKCDHEFKVEGNGVRCVHCHFGLMGPIEVKDGKLYHQGKKLPL